MILAHKFRLWVVEAKILKPRVLVPKRRCIDRSLPSLPKILLNQGLSGDTACRKPFRTVVTQFLPIPKCDFIRFSPGGSMGSVVDRRQGHGLSYSGLCHQSPSANHVDGWVFGCPVHFCGSNFPNERKAEQSPAFLVQLRSKINALDSHTKCNFL